MGDENLGGEEAGVRNRGTPVIISRKASSCRRDRALCRVSRGLIGGTPPKPSIANREKRVDDSIHVKGEASAGCYSHLDFISVS